MADRASDAAPLPSRSARCVGLALARSDVADCTAKVELKLAANEGGGDRRHPLQPAPNNWRLREGGDLSCLNTYIEPDHDFGSPRQTDPWKLCSGPLIEDRSLAASFASRAADWILSRLSSLPYPSVEAPTKPLVLRELPVDWSVV